MILFPLALTALTAAQASASNLPSGNEEFAAVPQWPNPPLMHEMKQGNGDAYHRYLAEEANAPSSMTSKELKDNKEYWGFRRGYGWGGGWGGGWGRWGRWGGWGWGPRWGGWGWGGWGPRWGYGFY